MNRINKKTDQSTEDNNTLERLSKREIWIKTVEREMMETLQQQQKIYR